jgi:hypothetical protein
MTDENLIGYVLNALDPDAQRVVEEELLVHPEMVRRLESARRALEPLAADSENPEPPRDLRFRTLARVAEYRCAEPVSIPLAPPIRSTAPVRSWWRRADVLVAASLLLVFLPMAASGITYARHRYNIIACQNNLRQFNLALSGYQQTHRKLPEVEEDPPRNYAGMVVPVLYEGGFLSPNSNLSVACPANGHRAPPNVTLEKLMDLSESDPVEFARQISQLMGCYSYSLGYRDKDGCLCGPFYDKASGNLRFLPIMADRPPFEQQQCEANALAGNSRNHGQKGQNVLFMDGHCLFFTTRNVGMNGDDIYLNRNNLPAAGVDCMDTVLGASNFRPTLVSAPDK